MFVAKSIGVDHKDLIQDVAYDFHGKRMATCSCDQLVKIWDLIEGEWKCTSSWKCHTGSVWRVAWAHPEFGQVIATCSFDRTAVIWEELPAESGQPCRWVKRGNLVDSRTSVVDIKFGPKHLGLILATCSVDGAVRIYEAADIMNLNVWNLAYEIQCQVATCCISWSTSRCFQPTIAVGSDDSSHTGGRVQIYEYNDFIRKYVKIESISTILDPVRDVAFSPNLGRSYHMLAVASKDVHLLTLKPLNRGDQSSLDGAANGSTKFEVRCIGQFSDHQSQVWRLSWNVTGTILASSGDDGYVRLWKGNYMDHWKCIAEIKGDSASDARQSSNALTNADRTNSRFTFSATSQAPVWH